MANILLVEDDELVRDMLQQVLERASHTVTSAIDGEEASHILKSADPDIMVTDIIMPKKKKGYMYLPICSINEYIYIYIYTSMAVFEHGRGWD